MDVSCPKCETIFELESSKVSSSGKVKLQCSECDHIFRIRSAVENTKRWMLKDQRGDVSYFSTFTTLQKWIMKGEASKVDEISRSGDKWVTLDSIGELAPIFQVLESKRDQLPEPLVENLPSTISQEIEIEKFVSSQSPAESQSSNSHQKVENGTDSESVVADSTKEEAIAQTVAPKLGKSAASMELDLALPPGIPEPQTSIHQPSAFRKPILLLLFLAAVAVLGLVALMSKEQTPSADVLGENNHQETKEVEIKEKKRKPQKSKQTLTFDKKGNGTKQN